MFNIANLRAAYALDKLYRISIAAGDGDYGSQIKAHYGFDAVHDDWKSQFIGGCSAPIQISEVITTTTTADNSGELLVWNWCYWIGYGYGSVTLCELSERLFHGYAS